MVEKVEFEEVRGGISSAFSSRTRLWLGVVDILWGSSACSAHASTAEGRFAPP